MNLDNEFGGTNIVVSYSWISKKSKIIKPGFFILFSLVLSFMVACDTGQGVGVEEKEEVSILIPKGDTIREEAATTEILWDGLERSKITDIAPRTGFLAPPFTLKDLNGNEINLGHFCGKYLYVVFWQMGCDACENVLVLLEEVHTSDELITVLGINVEDDEDVLREFVQNKGYSFPVLLDTNSNVFNDYQLKSVPATIAINGRGEITFIHSGPMIEENLERIRVILLEQWELIPLVV